MNHSGQCSHGVDGVVALPRTVWAFGVTAWELLTYGVLPYEAFTDDDRVGAFVRGGGQLERPAVCAETSCNELWVNQCLTATAH